VSNCPLCDSAHSSEFSRDKIRSYYICSSCQLIFVPREQIISSDEEKKRYDTHKNSPEETRYRDYLAQIAGLMIPQMSEGSMGLDFGCGASTLLGDILISQGYPTDSYDLFYHPQESIWKKSYDFIVLSEVIEHLREPREIMQALKERLNPGGKFFIKTALYPETKEKFDQWFYKRDPTHVQFFQTGSFETLRNQLGMSLMKVLAKDLFELHH
jgi:transcription initiation factor TFIIIB Brf1 subunit/transcription initiation factor TFIIB